MEAQKTPDRKSKPEQKYSKNIAILDSKLYYRAMIRKAMGSWYKYMHRSME